MLPSPADSTPVRSESDADSAFGDEINVEDTPQASNVDNSEGIKINSENKADIKSNETQVEVREISSPVIKKSLREKLFQKHNLKLSNGNGRNTWCSCSNTFKASSLGILCVFAGILIWTILDIVKGSCADIDSRIQRLESENGKLEEVLTRLANERQKLSDSVANFTQENSELQQNLNNLLEAGEEYSSQLGALSDANDVLSALVDRLGVTAEEFSEDVDAYVAEYSGLEALLDAGNFTLQALITNGLVLSRNTSRVVEETGVVRQNLTLVREKSDLLNDRYKFLNELLDAEFHSDDDVGYNVQDYNEFLEIGIATTIAAHKPSLLESIKEAIRQEFPQETFDFQKGKEAAKMALEIAEIANPFVWG